MKNQVVNIGEVVIGYTVKSFDLTSKKCDLIVSVKRGSSRAKRKTYKSVDVSSLLAWKLVNDSENYVLDRCYTSVMNSDNWRENPFQLIRYSDGDSIRFLLACVNERSSKKIYTLDPLGNTIKEVKYRYHNRSHYRRYRDYVKAASTTVES
jgi:hypothetical protein